MHWGLFERCISVPHALWAGSSEYSAVRLPLRHDPTFTGHTSITCTALLMTELIDSDCVYVMTTLLYLHDKLFDKQQQECSERVNLLLIGSRPIWTQTDTGYQANKRSCNIKSNLIFNRPKQLVIIRMLFIVVLLLFSGSKRKISLEQPI